MAGYLVIAGEISDPDAFGVYVDAVGPLLARHGARRLLSGRGELLEGKVLKGLNVVFEFPSRTAVRAFWSDPAYAPVKALRERCAEFNVLAFGEE